VQAERDARRAEGELRAEVLRAVRGVRGVAERMRRADTVRSLSELKAVRLCLRLFLRCGRHGGGVQWLVLSAADVRAKWATKRDVERATSETAFNALKGQKT
jgi:hypothetical protein